MSCGGVWGSEYINTYSRTKASKFEDPFIYGWSAPIQEAILQLSDWKR